MRVQFIRTHACQGGDGNHADVPDEQHDGRKYVDMDVSKCILDTQVHEAVSHGCLREGVFARLVVFLYLGTLLFCFLSFFGHLSRATTSGSGLIMLSIHFYANSSCVYLFIMRWRLSQTIRAIV